MTQNFRRTPSGRRVARSETLVSTVTSGKQSNVRRPADARSELLRPVQSGGYLTIDEIAVLPLELPELAGEIVGTPQ